MGLGASVQSSKVKVVKVSKSVLSPEVYSLIDIIRCKKGEERIDALKNLFEKTDIVENKLPMSSPDLGLLELLVSIITEDDKETKLLACKCLWYISRGDDTAKLNVADPNLPVIELLIKTMEECIDGSTVTNEDLLYAVIATVSRCTLVDGTLSHLYSPKFNLISAVKKLLLLEYKDFKRNTIWFLSNCFVYPSSKMLVPIFISANVPESICNILSDAINDSAAWGTHCYGSWSLTFLMRFCYHRDGASHIEQMKGVHKLLLNVQSQLISNFDQIQLFFIMTFIYGKDETVEDLDQSVLQSNKLILDDILSVFQNTINGIGGDGYSFGIFTIHSITNAIRVLSISDNNKEILVNHPDLLNLLIIVLKAFAHNDPPFTGLDGVNGLVSVGGGGADNFSVLYAIETIAQLSYYFESDEDLAKKFLKPELNFPKLLNEVLLKDPYCNWCKMQLKILQTRLNQKSFQDYIDNNSINNNTSKHIMISYSWSIGKNLVKALQAKLINMGFDVWRDETGSSVVSPMQGDVIEKMSEAIEAAHTVIICVSRW